MMNVWKEYENRQNNGLVALFFLSTSLMHEKNLYRDLRITWKLELLRNLNISQDICLDTQCDLVVILKLLLSKVL